MKRHLSSQVSQGLRAPALHLSAATGALDAFRVAFGLFCVPAPLPGAVWVDFTVLHLPLK